MSWKHISLRRVLLTALLLLGGWGLCSSLYQVKQSWDDYERSVELVAWSVVAGNIMTVAQHLSYERGRTAVVLKAPSPISEADRHFIDARRGLADVNFKTLDDQISHVPKIGYDRLVDKWERVQELRNQVDRDKVLPLAMRDPALSSRWTKETTGFLVQLSETAQELAKHYHQTGEAHRLNVVGFFAYRLRFSAGTEASMIVQRVASRTSMPLQEIMLVHEMRGSQKIMWAELERNVAYLDNDDFVQMLANLKLHRDALRLLQDKALNAWKMHRPVKVTVNALTEKSLPLLDGISEFVLRATQQANRVAKARMKVTKQVLFTHVALDISMLMVMLLAIFYVIKNVVMPLEAVDEKLRRIHFPMEDGSNFETNQIERLTRTASTLEQIFERKKRLEGELRELAFYDQLTHLPNRRLIEDRLLQHISRAKRQKSLLALLFIDLDHFKPINDDFGHETGDWVLRMVADRILSCIRESDAAARIGGDEFVVLVPDLLQIEDATMVAEKIREKLSQPFFMPNGQQFEISSSIGIAIYPIHAENVEGMMRLSDEAMYEAKNTGRDKVVMATSSPD